MMLTHPSKARGFSLIEVLVSLTLLAVGLGSLAMLQVKASYYNTSSHFRSIAIAQLADITDRMRANRAGIEAGAYDEITGLPTSVPSCQSCSALEIATLDQHEWNMENAHLLPLGQGTVTRVNDGFRIQIMWQNHKSGGTGTGCSGDHSVDLSCTSVLVEL